MEENSVRRLLRIVECPICREVPSPPIYNCVNGHFACSSCRPQLQTQKCAYCLGSFTRMRNYPLEELVSSEIFTCKYAEYGCTKKFLKLSEFEEHNKKCWSRFLVPGKVKLISKTTNDEEYSNYEGVNECPKCQFSNPPRKLKCLDCNFNLRVPTPMFLPFDYEVTSTFNQDK